MAAIGKQSFHVAAATGICRSSGRRFGVGEAYIAALVEPEGSDDLEREDYSIEAWGSGARPGGGRLFASWRATMGATDSPRRVLADDESLLDLFEQLGSETDARKVALRFVLALLLIRRRVLALEGSEAGGNGQGVLLVRERGVERPPKGPALVEVIDPELDEEAVAGVIEQMKAITGDAGATTGAEGGA